MHVIAEDSQEQTEFEMRPYQVEAWASLDIAREEGRTRALGNLATGLGKTFVAAVDAMRYRELCAAQDPPMYPRILYVSHQNDINEQAAKTFRLVIPDAKIDFFKTKRKHLPDADVTFATLQGLFSELDRFDPQDFEYIIWDESHHLEAETYRAVRDHFDPLFEHAITATLERSDGKDIQEYFGAPLYQKTLPEGIAEGWLADVEYHVMFDKTIKDKLRDGFEPKTLQEVKELFRKKPPPEAIKQAVEEEIIRQKLKNPKTIVFCNDIKEAEEMAGLLGGVAYHSKIKDRHMVLANFRSGEIRRIIVRDMLNEGVDVPDAELLVFLRVVNGLTFEQQLGRGLRRTKYKTKVHVFDFVANLERIVKARQLRDAIRHKAEALGSRNVRERTTTGGGLAGDARIRTHTPHANFDFDSMAIDLLKKYEALTREPPRPGEISIMDFIAQEGVAYHTVGDLLDKLVGEGKIVVPTRRFGTRDGKALTPEVQALLREHPKLQTKASGEVMSVRAFAKAVGAGQQTVKDIIAAHGLPTVQTKFLTAAGRATATGTGLSPATQQRIKDILSTRAPAPQDGAVGVSVFARQAGMAYRTLVRLIKDHKIPTVESNFGGTRGLALPPSSQQLILRLRGRQ